MAKPTAAGKKGSAAGAPQIRPIASNRKARHDYHILEDFECGVVLRGTEVKSIRAGRINLRDSFARVENEEIILYGVDIPPYERASYAQHANKRPRKLLLHRREIATLIGFTAEKGCTLVALDAYWKGQVVKIKLGVAKGKAAHDRRHDLKKRVETREAEREMARFNKG
ncbi:SsrA-binding protein SmpB [soil metagenome]